VNVLETAGKPVGQSVATPVTDRC